MSRPQKLTLNPCDRVLNVRAVSCIETIGINEVYTAMRTSHSGLRAIQEANRSDKIRVAMAGQDMVCIVPSR